MLKPEEPSGLGKRLFEDLMIIGPDISNDMLPFIEDSYDEYIDSKNFYLFREDSDKTSCHRKNAVRKFCFPSGVKIRRIKDD
jgi:hypothetical protein